MRRPCCLGSGGSSLQHLQSVGQRSPDPKRLRKLRKPPQLGTVAQVAAERGVCEVFADQVPQPEGVDDGALAVADREGLTVFERLDASAELECFCSKYVDVGGWAVDPGPM